MAVIRVPVNTSHMLDGRNRVPVNTSRMLDGRYPCACEHQPHA
jgi:hypothetical protein